MLFDAHNHLQDDWLAPHLEAVVTTLEQLGLGGAVVNGTHPDDWARVSELAQRWAWVRPSYGLHPWHCGRRPTDWREQFERRLLAEPAAHVGEIGLDRWILDSARPDDPRLAGTVRAPLEEQVEVFQWQLAWAAAHDRAATIHCLQAWGPLREILETTPLPARGFLLHAYGGSAELAEALAELGAYFSFNPSFLDPRKARQQAVFRHLPADRLLVETDAPAMPPPPSHTLHPLPDGPHGVRLAHPGNLGAAYAGLAALRAVSEEELHEQVAENYRRLFG
jgi:TatD DNase family protein